MEFDPIKNIKCIICEKIGTRAQIGGMNGWQFAANVPFNYICGPACAEVLKAEQEKKKKDKKK